MSGPRLQPPLAIIGVGCRFPGAGDLPAYGRLLFTGRCALAELPPHRFDQARYYDPTPGVYGKSYSRLGGCVEDGPCDHAALGLPPEVGASRDRAPLWALLAARDALADAGMGPRDLRGTNTAVVLGHARGSTVAVDHAFATGVEELLGAVEEARLLQDLSPSERREVRSAAVAAVRDRYPRAAADHGAGRVTSAVAGLVSAALGLTGRHLVVDAACASSFASLQIAARALGQGRADLVLAGGVSFSQEASVILFAQSRALSADGSFPFDARANGFVSSDGVGVFLLARLDDALARGYPVRGVVRGIGASCDGKGKGLWAPRREGQVLAMERALARSGVDPARIGLIEAHGTSTALGDATEVAALTEVLGGRVPRDRPIPIGSVKGNIGHCREAAGAAGLIKVLLALERELVPPSIGYESPNPDIDWERTPFRIAREAAPWPRAASPRVAGVNSFGIGGLNYQVVVEEPPAPARTALTVPAGPTPALAAAAVDAEPVAIVGMGCLFPGARSPRELWRRLLEGHCALSQVPAARWSAGVYHEPGTRAPWRTCADRGGFLDSFTPDWRRYKMPPNLVDGSDPLQFMLLEAALDALEDARVDLEVVDRRRIAVVVGSGFGSDFALALTLALRVPEAAEAAADALRERGFPAGQVAAIVEELEGLLRARLPHVSEDSSGSFSSSTLASRLSKTLDLQGPAFSVDAACASSLAALEAAVEALREGDCDVVLCASGDRSLRVQRFEALTQAGLLSPTGQGRPFDAGADGMVPAEGAGVCVLKRLADARAAGDHIHAVVRGVASASDGEWKDIHRPAAHGLAAAMRRAHAAAGVEASSIGYVEAHASGSPAAEEAEIDALSEVFGERSRPLLLGAVKANVGHAQAAGGMAGLIKAALCLGEGTVPPTPGVASPNPRLAPGLAVPDRAVPLPRHGRLARAGVSALGLGGIGAHVVLESAPPPRAAEPVVVRAASREALREALGLFAALPEAEWATAGTVWGTGPVAVGLPIGAGAAARARRAHESLGKPGADPLLAAQGIAVVAEPLDGPLCALFPGQGAQYAGMLEEVAAAYPRAAAVLDACDRALRARGEEALSAVLWGDAASRLGEVRWTQLAVLAGGLMMREVALAHGLVPGLVTGHSYGEYPALVAAGALSLEQAIEWTLRRCAAIERDAAPGGMAVVFASPARAGALLEGVPGFAAVSNVNAPEQVVVSGEDRALEALAERCAAAGLECRRIPVPGAFHSELMRAAADRFAAEADGLTVEAPRVRVLSSIGARELSSAHELRAGLLLQLTAPVDFVAQVERAYAAGFHRFVELGPGGSLSRMVGQILAGRPHVAISLDDRKEPGVRAVARGLAALRAAEPSSGRPVPCPAASADASAADAGAGLFDPEEWRRLSARSGWTTFWRATRPSLQVFARHLFEQGGADLEPHVVAAGEASRGGIRFFDVTTERGNDARPAPEPAGGATSAAVPAASTAARAGAENGAGADVRRFLLEQVIECTGYPPDLLDLDADMEADLGIDSVKQAQIFGRVRARFDLPTDDRVSLRDFPTLRTVLDYVVSRLDGAGGSAPAAAVGEPAAVEAPPPAPAAVTDLPVLRLAGTPFEMGLAHGRAQSAAIGATLDAYMAFLGKDGLKRPVLQGALDRPEEYFDGDALEEIRGMAEGSGLPERHLLAYNLDSALFPEYGGCTQVGLAASAHGHPGHAGALHAVNEDSPLALHLGVPLPRVVQVRVPARGHAHVLFSVAGQVGGINGAAASGLVASSCTLLDRSRPGRAPGLLHPLLVRRVLQHADSTADAVELVRTAARSGAWSLLLSHAREERLRCVEYDGPEVNEASGLERHWTANHGVVGPAGSDVPEHSRHRLERLRELLPGDGRPVGCAALQAALLDRFDRGRGRAVTHRTMNTVRRVDNVMSLVADVASGRLAVAAVGEADTAAWRELDLPELLGGPAWDARSDAASPPAVMARYVLRTVPEPLGPVAAGAYRPDRLLLVGDGPVARALEDRLRRRGVATEVLPLDADPDRLVGAAESLWARGPLPDVCLLSGLARVGAPTGLAALGAGWSAERPRLLEGPFRLLQAWVRRQHEGERRTLSAVTAMGGRLGQGTVRHAHPEGGGVAGLFRALRREIPTLRLKLLDVEPGAAPEDVAGALLAELDSGDRRLEAAVLRGVRRIPRLVPAAVRCDPAHLGALAGLPYVILAGGGRGVTAEVAVRLARCGVRRFHLLGRTRLPERIEEWSALDASGRARLRQDLLDRLRRERGRVTPVDWEQAWTPVENALEIGATLRRLAEAGASARYHAVDVADRDALGVALRTIREEDGPIHAVVHGAGVERSRAFVSQQPSDWEATCAPKSDGTLNLATLTASDPLRFFATFASVAGRFGGLGQADYSLASELQCRLTGALAAERPACRAVAFAWPAWDEVGMAARGDVRERLLARGRRLMPLAEGLEHFVAELAASTTEVEVAYLDDPAGLDLDGVVAPATTSADDAPDRRRLPTGPLVDLVVEAAADRVLAEAHLAAEADAFLQDHRLDGIPVLPAVAALELIAETAALAGVGDRPCLHDVRIEEALKVRPGHPRTLRVEASRDGDGWSLALRADVAGRGGRLMEPDRLFVRGRATAGHAFSEPRTNGHVNGGPPTARAVAAVYGSAGGGRRRIVHGPSFQTLREVSVGDGDLHAGIVVASPAAALRARRGGTAWLLPAPALDGCLQACGVVARLRLGVLALPSRFGRLQAGRAARDGETCRVRIHLRGRTRELVRFDFVLAGEDGAVLLRVDDYGARVFAAIEPHDGPSPAALAAPPVQS